MKALLSIDYTNDFIAPHGAMTIGEMGSAIEEELVRVTKQYTDAGDYIVYAVDRHEIDDQFHPESKLFPPHNLVDTVGRQLYGKLHHLYEESKALPSVHWLDKRYYSAFSGTDLNARLIERGIKDIHLTGVCTDICVLHTAVDAYNLGYRLTIHQNAVASHDPAGHQWAFNHFKSVLGAEII